MFFKKLIILLAIMFLVSSSVMAKNKPVLETDMRELFQNNNAVIYAINIRTFNANDVNGNDIIDIYDSESVGTFINAIARLDELKELGVNTIHLLPITPVGKIKALGTAGSLYALSDFHSINLQLVDEKCDLSPKEQAKKFIDECHKRDIRVLIDLPSCGSYDLFLNRPELFVQDSDGNAIIPADWLDVRLFAVPDTEKEIIGSDIYVLHRIFVDYMIDIGADGIRADVATIKPYAFWKELIKYARNQKKGFLFLAEASELWTEPASSKAYFTDYKKLLEAGFDGYYGDYFDLKNWTKMEDLSNSVHNRHKILKKYSDKKSVIGSFETHDVVSPLLTGGENFSKIIIWLNATLPLNPYYIDGFLQADDYMYEYSNKLADETYTDDEYYYVHQGQIDIFNFSRKPGSDSNILLDEHKMAMDIRHAFKDVITKGQFIKLKTNNEKVFAYQREYNRKSVVVICNRNLVSTENVKVKIQKINKKSKVTFVKSAKFGSLEKSNYNATLRPGEIVILTVE
ncbi:alpha-glucosidase C-terminal domain-containing protein [bacterium]|nr:alpha-glucosidase C-terminal domain-containing protein [bacterium]